MLEKKRTPAAKTVPMQERIGLARDVGRLIRDVLLVVLVIFCILNPPVVRGWLGQLGMSKMSLFGMIELTPGKENEVAAAVDAATQQRDAAYFERNDLVNANRQAMEELRQLSQHLPAEQRPRLAQTIATLHAETNNANIPLPPDAPLQQILLGAARHQVGSTGRWAVVFGGDPDLAGARRQIAARGDGLDNASIVKRYNSYRSIVEAGNAEAAARLLPAATRRRPDAYVVNLDTWCTNPVERDGYRDCGND
ncbi:MAG TPA: hypothetical protein VMS43_08100 [Allosphingosinicella sp.]|nr:hypothetical protein [Allosphingosinicella sp.]